MRERKREFCWITQRQIFTYTTETTKFWVAASALCPSHFQHGPDRVLGRQRQNLHNRRDRTLFLALYATNATPRVLFTHARELDHAINDTMSKEREKEERESCRVTQTTKFYIIGSGKIRSCCLGAPPVSLSTRTWLSPRQTTTEFTQQTRSNPDWLLLVPYSTVYTKQSLTHARARVRFRHYQHTANVER